MNASGSTPVDAGALLAILLLIETTLVAAYLVDLSLGQPIRTLSALFNLDAESTIPSWFSSIQLFCIGVVLGCRGLTNPVPARPGRWFWCLAAAVFVFLSMDEAVALHEQITTVFKRFVWAPRFTGNHGIWIPVYGAALFVLLLGARAPLLECWRQWPHPSGAMAAGVFVFLCGAVGFEIVSYAYLRHDTAGWWYRAEVAAEEFLEMAGASLILYGMIRLPASTSETVTCRSGLAQRNPT